MGDSVEMALPVELDIFRSLFDRACLEDVETIDSLREMVVDEPSLLFFFGRFFSDPKSLEKAQAIGRHPAFDLSVLKTWVEKTPPALMVMAGLAQGGNESAQKMIPELKLDPQSYHKTVHRDPDYLPYLTLMAEAGHDNIAALLAQLVWGGDDLILSGMVGIAAEGSHAAFAALNAGVTAGHLSTLVRFAEQYGEDPVYGISLRKVLQSPAFRPIFLPLREEEEELEAPDLMAKLAGLGNPFAQESVIGPWFKAVGQ